MSADETPRPAISWSVDESVLDAAPLPESSERRRATPTSARAALAERFALGDELGRGAMGVVYRARDLAGDREVALKVLARASTAAGLERLRREGVLTAALRHPGIVTVHSAGQVNGVSYLAYELIPGARPLSELLPLPPEQAGRLVLELARALEHAHQQGVLHRDLKPGNVLVDERGRARIVDFGLGRAHDLERLTQTGALVGTPTHMAPEQISPELAHEERFTAATDVWSLGVILYQALTGELPFRAETLVELAAVICSAPPTPPSRLRPEVDTSLEAVCLRALAKQPQARYHSAGALADALERALTQPAPARRAQWVLLAALLGMATVLSWAFAPPADRERPPNRTPAPEPGPQPTSPEGFLEAVADELTNDQPGAAVALAREALSRWPETYALQEALLRSLAQAGQPDAAEEALASWDYSPAASQAACLRLALRGARGEDVRLELRALARETGDDEAVSLRLALDELQARRLHAAREAIKRSVGRSAETRRLQAATRAALVGDHATLKRLPAWLRSLLAGCRLGDAWRAWAFVQREQDPSRVLAGAVRDSGEWARLGLEALTAARELTHQPELLGEAELLEARLRGLESEAGLAAARRALELLPGSPEVRRLAAELALRSGEPNQALAALMGDQDRPALWLRGRALLLSQEPRRAAALLRDAWGPRLDERIGRDLERALTLVTPTPPELAEVRARLALLAGEQRQRALRTLESAQRSTAQPADRNDQGAEAFELDPLLHEARYYQGRGSFWTDPARGLAMMAEACSRQPELLTAMTRTTLTFRGLTNGIPEHLAEPAFAPLETRWGRLAEAILATTAAEFEPSGPAGTERARSLLEALLVEDPAEVVAWQLLGFVLLRQGELDHAEHALEIAATAVPESAIGYWYRALLAGARRRPAEEVLSWVAKARENRLKVWSERGWTSELYPELESVRDLTEYKRLIVR